MKHWELDILLGVLALFVSGLVYFAFSGPRDQPIDIVRIEVEKVIQKKKPDEALVVDLRQAVHEGEDAVLMTTGMSDTKAFAWASLAGLLSFRLIYSGVRQRTQK
jgi:hypothetical protein